MITRLSQGLKMSTISQFRSGRGHTSPLPELGRPQARLIHDFAKQTGWSSRGKHGHEGFHAILKRLTWGKPRGDERGPGPQRLGLGVATPTACRPLQRRLDRALPLVKPGLIVLGGTPSALGHGAQCARPGYRLAGPSLLLLQPIRFPFFVIDFNGPAMASDAGDPPGLPLQLVTNEISGRIG